VNSSPLMTPLSKENWGGISEGLVIQYSERGETVKAEEHLCRLLGKANAKNSKKGGSQTFVIRGKKKSNWENAAREKGTKRE